MQNMDSHFKQTGVGLIEVLIALFVLSIGLLGVAYLQMVGAKSNHDALMRSQAIIAVEQLAESMRSNARYINRSDSTAIARNPATDNFYSQPDNYNFANLTCAASTNKWECFCKTRPATIPQCRDELTSSSQCTEEQTAIFDAYEASCNLAKAGDELTMEVQCEDNNNLDSDPCSGHSIHRIFVRWPVGGWQGLDVTANSRCAENISGTETQRQCVVLDVVLGG